MKGWTIVALVFVAACSGSPTAPTPVPVPPPAVVIPPPVVIAPPVNPLLSDPRFDRNFYRQIVHDSFEHPNQPQPLRRHTGSPFVYLFTVDERGTSIHAPTLDAVAAALINVAGSLTGRFGLLGLETGAGPAPSGPNVIAVRWSSVPTSYCGQSTIGGSSITLHPNTPNCPCGGLAIRTGTVKHELGHALGFYHADSVSDLMFGTSPQACDRNPSEREKFHAMVAYSQPLGSLEP